MYELIVFLPLLGFLIAGVFGPWIGARGAEYVTCSLLGVCFVLSWIAFVMVAGGADAHVPIANWFTSGKLVAAWALRIDTLTAVMLVVVTTVSFLVHVYSIGYMSDDPSRPRFFAYLSLFTFAMLMLVTADNLVQLFFGWEGVGLMSYLLIGFWYDRPSANAAAIKAFVVNRVGDFGFSLGIFLTFYLTGSVAFDQVFAAAPGLVGKTVHFIGFNWDALTLACLLLFMGAMGKSAQFLLHTWLPDAMEGPTPVSALIHAATMVTAGVFMVARLSPLFELSPAALSAVTIVGGTTAFFAATIGLVQNGHQESRRLLDLLAAWLHVRRPRRRRLQPRHLSISSLTRSSRALSVPRLRARSSPRCITSRTCARWGGCGKEMPVHVLDDDGRDAGVDRRRDPVHFDRLRRLRLEGPDHRSGFRLPPLRLAVRVRVRGHRGRIDRFLYLASHVHDFFGQRGDWVSDLPAKAHDDHGHGDQPLTMAPTAPPCTNLRSSCCVPLAVLALGATLAGTGIPISVHRRGT